MPFEQNCHDPICFRKITLAENKEDRCEGGSGGERERSKARGPVKSQPTGPAEEAIEQNSHAGDKEK